MDFDQLPNEIFVHILRYIPLRERFRIERTNKRFQEISPIAISKIKSINPTKDSIQNMNRWAISKLFSLCSPNLAEIEIGPRLEIRIWIEIFSQFSYPRLVKVDICAIYVKDYFGPIMAKNRNLRLVRWIDGCSRLLIMPENVVCKNLERLDIQFANDATFRSLTEKCPNVKHFCIGSSIDSISLDIFDNFLATCPKLEELQIFGPKFRYDQLVHFWRLSSMRSLCLGYRHGLFNDNDLERISTSFPRMENLELDRVEMTNRGVSALARLKNLRSIRLASWYGGENIDSGVRRLIEECVHLQLLSIQRRIMSATLIALFRHCRQLRYLKIHDVIDVSTIEEATTVVQSFGRFVKRNISIYTLSQQHIWNSENVKTALEELRADGHVIKINEDK